MVHNGKKVPGLVRRTTAEGRVVYEFFGRLGGKVTRQKLAATTPTDAVHEIEALRTDVRRGEVTAVRRGATVRTLVEQFKLDLDTRVDHLDRRRRRSKRTVDSYKAILDQRIVPALGSWKVADLDEAAVRAFLAKQSGAPNTIANYLTVLSSLCRFAVKQKLLRVNPCRLLDADDRPQRERQSEPRRLDVSNIEAILAEASVEFRAVFATCAYAGLRISEALALTWADVADGHVTVARQLGVDGQPVPLKSRASERRVPIVPALAQCLRSQREYVATKVGIALTADDALVFPTWTGQPQSRRNALRSLALAAEKAGVGDVSLHDLRHTFGSLALRTMSLAEVSRLMGHGDVAITAKVYVGVIEGEAATEKRRQDLVAAFG